MRRRVGREGRFGEERRKVREYDGGITRSTARCMCENMTVCLSEVLCTCVCACLCLCITL